MQGLSIAALREVNVSRLLPSAFGWIGDAVSSEQPINHRLSFDWVMDPATGEQLVKVPQQEASAMSEAIDAAAAVFPQWRDAMPAARQSLLRAWASKIREEIGPLSVILSAEQGKPLGESEGEIRYGASYLDWYADEALRANGETLPSHKPGSFGWTVRQAVGVTAAITPWNFPMAMITRKAGAALAAGCPMIVKPAPETPLSALALMTLAREVGIPPAVFQVILGDGIALAQVLANDSRVRAISFTGSTQVGKTLIAQCSASVKKISMELGGHAPFIVFADVDLDDAVDGCMAAKFATSGQDCLAANRIYVQRPIYEAFCERFAARVAALRVGHGLAPDTQIGPMTKSAVAQKCRAHIDDAVELGARVLVGGTHGINGRFVAPTVLADVTESMAIAHEETFGPIAALLPFDSEDEVLTRANASEFGLAAYVYTRDLNRTVRCTTALEYGMVAVNTPSFTGAPIPFGGWKSSGLGREGARLGIDEFMEWKYVCLGAITR